MAKWKRIKAQEDIKHGGNVYRWFERGDDVMSVVDRGLPGEVEMRICSDKIKRTNGCLMIPGHASIVLKRTDAELVRSAEMMLKRYS
jgi:hypothetical protein